MPKPRRAAQAPSLLRALGEHALKARESARGMFAFFGENVIALGNLLRGRAQFRWSDAFLTMQECGPQGLGIVAMINFLVGLILAFVGAVELKRFGASIYVADLVGIATVREMGCIMTGIILCGRTGASFAAQLGTMKVNEEISALETFGISPHRISRPSANGRAHSGDAVSLRLRGFHQYSRRLYRLNQHAGHHADRVSRSNHSRDPTEEFSAGDRQGVLLWIPHCLRRLFARDAVGSQRRGRR